MLYTTKLGTFGFDRFEKPVFEYYSRTGPNFPIIFKRLALNLKLNRILSKHV